MKRLILIDGMSGAGKTTTTLLLCKSLPRTAHIGLDRIKKYISDYERGARDNAIAREVVFAMAQKYLELNISVIVEQPFRTKDHISKYDTLAKEHAIPCHKLQFYTDPDIALSRVIERTRNSESTLTEAQAKKNIALFESFDTLGFTTIDTTTLSPEEVSEFILKRI